MEIEIQKIGGKNYVDGKILIDKYILSMESMQSGIYQKYLMMKNINEKLKFIIPNVYKWTVISSYTLLYHFLNGEVLHQKLFIRLMNIIISKSKNIYPNFSPEIKFFSGRNGVMKMNIYLSPHNHFGETFYITFNTKNLPKEIIEHKNITIILN